jgi:ribonuclease BN (tRNA processing enzyme)
VRYTLIGTGSPRLSLERAGTSQLAQVGDDLLLIDCGPGSTHRLKKAAVDLEAIRYLFMTHHHYDHIADYALFTLMRWDHSRDPQPLHVFGPPGTERITQALFGPGGAFDPDITARTQHPMSQSIFAMRGGRLPRPRPEVRARDVPRGVVHEGAGWRMLAGPARHAQPFLECYSYRLETAERTIVYTGDTGLCPELPAFVRGADTLIYMCCFPDDVLQRSGMVENVGGPTLAGQVAAEAGVRKLVLTHPQSEQIDTSEGMAEAVAIAGRHFTGEIVFGQDLMDI